MFAVRVLGVLAAMAVTLIKAQTATRTATSTTSSSSGPATVTIAVGVEGMVFTPKEATASIGDIIRFNFYPGGHRVARAAFGWPCIPYQYVLGNLNKKGFNTGEFDPQVVSDNPPHFDVRVNDTEPIFFYCYAPGSCVDYHMIGVINQNATETYDAQLAFAQNVTYQLAPGDPFPSETPSPKTTTPGAPGPASSSSSSGGSGGDGGGGGLSTGAIAGIAIGAAALLVLTAALIYLCGRRGGFDKAYRKSALRASLPPGGTTAAAADTWPALGMSEIRYANGGGGDGTLTKSPGQTSASAVAGFDGSTLGVSGGGGGVWPSPRQGTLPGYGLGFTAGQHGYGGHFPSPHSSPPPPDQHTAPFHTPPPPVELPTGEAPAPTQSPPPGYRGRDSWVPGQEGHYRPSQKPLDFSSRV